MLVHGGWQNVRLVDGSGDGGADLVAESRGAVWVVQCKFRTSNAPLGTAPIDEVMWAKNQYGAETAVVAANSPFSLSAREYADGRRRKLGIDLRLWGPEELIAIGRQLPRIPAGRPDLRDYQDDAVKAIWADVTSGSRNGLLLMATGLGKTRVASEVAHLWLTSHVPSEVLVIAHTVDLIHQLERALWRCLPADVATHLHYGSEKPKFLGGVTLATHQSLQVSDIPGVHEGRYGLVIVDEAHHAPAVGYSSLLESLDARYVLGLTATPWRGDDRAVEDLFGQPVYSIGIVEGMARGFLAQVDYRMLVDNLDWDFVQHLAGETLSIRDLNRRLFLPQRDEAAIEVIQEHIVQSAHRSAIVFCRSIRHAETIAAGLRHVGVSASPIHSSMSRIEITQILHRFVIKDITALVTVDMLNEGIDLPDVTLIVFMRVTHSRRIFVQQLGRGLRLAPGKDRVTVLDFVADVRRIAAGVELNADAKNVGALEKHLRLPEVVRFIGDSPLPFFDAYLSDVAALQDTADNAKVYFPGE